MAGERLNDRERLGTHVFSRGMPQGVRQTRTPIYTATIYDLLSAYGARRNREARAHYKPVLPVVYSLEAARNRLATMLDQLQEWAELTGLLPDTADLTNAEGKAPPRASLLASAFLAGLELTKEGRTEIQQAGTFDPIYVRARAQLAGEQPIAEAAP